MAGKHPQKKRKVPAILRVTPLADHRLNIRFGGGSILELNMGNRLRTVRYYPLNETRVFHSAVTDGAKIIFDTGSKFELDIFTREAVSMALRPPGCGVSILRVSPMEKARIRLELLGGSVLELNLENQLHLARYSPLKDPALFRSVSTDGESLIFGDALRIDAEELTGLTLFLPMVAREEACG